MVSYEYIAGFFDGEGYVAFTKRHKTNKIELVVSMANTHRQVMDEIQKVAGSIVTFHKGYHGFMPHYRLTFCGRKALEFLIAIQPYSVVKREEIDLALEFIKIMKPRYSGLGGKLTVDEIQEREDLYLKMKAMKGNRGANTWTLNLG